MTHTLLMRRSILVLVTLGILLVPSVAGAADWIPLVKCGGSGQVSCTPCHIFETTKNIFDLVLYGITGPIAAFMIVWAGGMMLLGGGNLKLYGEGVTMLRRTLIGVTIILLAWVATNFLIKSLIRGGQGDAWYEFSCPAGLSVIEPLEVAPPAGGSLPALPEAVLLTPEVAGSATLLTPEYLGSDDGASSCSQDAECPGTCPKLAPLLSGYENASLLEAIMYNESSCLIKPRPSGAGAYGLMQMKPETANANRVGCDVTQPDTNGNPVPVTITAAWLTSEQNLEKIVCVANNVVNSLKGACGSSPLNIAAGYNGGPGACEESRDCPEIPSCVDGRRMRRWECPWDNRSHTAQNTGYIETRRYAPRVAACAQ